GCSCRFGRARPPSVLVNELTVQRSPKQFLFAIFTFHFSPDQHLPSFNPSLVGLSGSMFPRYPTGRADKGVEGIKPGRLSVRSKCILWTGYRTVAVKSNRSDRISIAGPRPGRSLHFDAGPARTQWTPRRWCQNNGVQPARARQSAISTRQGGNSRIENPDVVRRVPRRRAAKRALRESEVQHVVRTAGSGCADRLVEGIVLPHPIQDPLVLRSARVRYPRVVLIGVVGIGYLKYVVVEPNTTRLTRVLAIRVRSCSAKIIAF